LKTTEHNRIQNTCVDQIYSEKSLIIALFYTN